MFESTYLDLLIESLEERSESYSGSDEKGNKKAFYAAGSHIDKEDIESFIARRNLSYESFFNAVFAFTFGKFSGRKEFYYTTFFEEKDKNEGSVSESTKVKPLRLYCDLSKSQSITSFIGDTDRRFKDSMKDPADSDGDVEIEKDVSSEIHFFYHDGNIDPDSPEGRDAENTLVKPYETKVVFNVVITAEDGKFHYSIEYRDDLFTEDYITRFFLCMENVSEEFLKKETLSEVSLISETMVSEMEVFNMTEKDYPLTDIVSMFRTASEKYPDRTAVMFGKKVLTYSELDKISDKVAGYLRAQGIGKGDVVSILISRSEYMPITALGVLKSGAAYQPLDPTYPVERLIFMMKDANSTLLITEEALLKKVPEYKRKVLLTKDISALPTPEANADHPTADDLFILLYTSGSTGVPKGVKLTHGNISNFCFFYHDRFELDETGCVAAYASFGFDACMMDMYAPLTVGASVCIVEENIRLDLPAVEELFKQCGVTHAFMTTQVGHRFYTLANVPTLKYLITGGERLAPVEPRKDISTKLVNGYGPTECTIFTTTCVVDRLFSRIPIGVPVSNCKCYVVDKSLNRLPFYVPGELLVAGRGVGLGYLNHQELTDKEFISNPFTDEAEYSRAYRTGDMVRLLPDGHIDFIGRNDSQVKVRGYRIELTEIESVIREFPGIKDVTVQAFDDANGGKFLAAYIVSYGKTEVADINAFIAARKPSYMVPAVTMQLESIPLNQNQKVDRKALPSPEFGKKHEKVQEDKPRPLTSFEKEILSIVKQVLGDIDPGITENLMFYGLTSISAISLSTELSKHFNIDIHTAKLLQDTTIEGIENLIFTGWKKKDFFTGNQLIQPAPKIGDSSEEGFYPLSSVQLGVYYDTMKHEAETIYNIPFCISFEDADIQKLKSSLLKCVEAHPFINTHIEIRNDSIVQIRNDDFVPEIPVKEMTYEEFSSYKHDFIRPFNLLKGPLYRFEIVQVLGKIYLFLDIHHIIFDGFSISVFMKDLCKAYEGDMPVRESYSAFDYAVRESEQMTSDAYEEGKEYYKKLFSNYEAPTEIPADKSEVEEEGLASSVCRFIEKEEIEKFSRRLGVTPAAMFLSVLFETASRFTSTKNIYLSTIDSGRDTIEKNDCIGMFVHTIPVGMDLSEGFTVEGLVKASNDVLRNDMVNEAFPFTEVAAEFGYRTEIMYTYQADVVSWGHGQQSGFSYDIEPIELSHPKFKLTFEVSSESEKTYCLKVIYNTALYSQGYMEKLADSLLTLSQGMLKNEKEAVKNLTILTDTEKSLLEKYRATGSCELPEKFAHKMFESVVREHRNETALIGVDKTLTFGELNSEANIVAHNLIKRGVKRGDSVVLLLPRRTFYFACLFGVLKSGAAFIPCDPEYPKDRVSYITTNADSRFIITTERFKEDYPGEKVLLVEDALTGVDEGDPDVEVTPEDLSLMIYTSGSTGKPKGAMLKHKGLSNFFTQHPSNTLQQIVEKKGHMIMSTATVTFDVCMMEALTFLMRGKPVVFTSEDQMNNPVEFVKLFEKYPIDTISATPSRYTQYLEYKPYAEALARCNIIMVAGEAFPNTLLHQLQSLSKASIINAYAPSEVTIAANISDLKDYDYVHLGHPIQNVHEYIVDADDNPVPAGVIGELIIAGIGVGAGYMNLPERTKKSYITYNGERAYRSGDYAKWDEEGNLILLGRRDNQVKLRGLRIELNEISELMEKQEDIMKAVAVIRKVNGHDNLCAYFTARKKIDISQLMEELKKHLTRYMIPTAYMQLDELPSTPNGKTDLKLLPEPEIISGGSFVEPANEAERTFCRIFSEVLKIDKVGAEDDFFMLGGTSLTVTGVMIKAQDEGYQLYYNEVFKYTTPRQLAQFVKGGEAVGKKDAFTQAISDYDYTEIDKLLENNTLSAFLSGEKRAIGNILLTGATGYMGAHVLAEYILSETGQAYCIVRKGKYSSAERHLKNVVNYYFGEKVSDHFKDRIHVIDGDVTDYSGFEKAEEYPIDTVFNCAANVKHFSTGTDIEDINIGGARNCVKFCEKTNARLIHFSTTSVAGAIKAGTYGKELNEQTLYLGQLITNQYTVSKFISEREVLSAVSQGRIDGKVIRVGLLTARESDGEFQMNYMSNSFIGKLRGFSLLKAFPYSFLNYETRMGAIDTSVKAFLKLATAPKDCCVFHATNSNVVPLVNIIMIMKKCGMEIEFTEDDRFGEIMTEVEKDPKKAAILQSLFAYSDREEKDMYVPVDEGNEYTTQVLARMGFIWHETGDSYIYRFIEALKGLGFYDPKYINR